MLRAPDLRGCIVALITPMTSEEGRVGIDSDAFHKQIADVIDAGVRGILIAGTTGQSATLTHDEHVELVKSGSLYARGYAAGKGQEITIIASAGSNSTHEAVSLSRRILSSAQVDALLHVTGYYNNPPQEGLIKHFRLMGDLAGEHGSSIILYNVPTRTKSNLEADTTIELAGHPAIIGIKEASGDPEQIQKILDHTSREEFTVVSGEDDMVAEIMRRGGTGVISASANVWPHEFQVLCDLAEAGHHDKASELQEALLPCVKAVFCVKNPIPLHYMLGTDIRMPLVRMDELREPLRSEKLALVEKALAIQEFPHAGQHAGPKTVVATS